MSLRHQVRGRQTDVQHDKVGGDADMCNADHSLSFKSTSSCSRGTSSRRGSQRTASKLSNGNRNNLTDATHSRQENRKKLKAHGLKKNMNRDDFRSKQQENSEAANCKPSLLPPIKPQGAPMQHTPSPSRYPIHRLGNQLWDLQQQPAASATEIQLIKCPDGHQEVVLQHLKNWGNKQPQVLIQHSNTVYTLQELVQQAWARNRALVRQLNATKARLQSICNALWKQQQQLSQEWSLGEREKLVQHISALTLDLDLKNKRIQVEASSRT
ncbi:lebercilin-like protein [Arapaima gigas]